MTVTIFGATGLVGTALVKQCLYNGHQVRAFGRNMHTLDVPEQPELELYTGAVFDEAQVLKAVKGADVVLSALGGGTDGTDHSRSLGIKNILKQMEKAGVKRIVALGGAGVLPIDEEGKLLMDAAFFPPALLPVSREHEKAFATLAASSSQWTMLCPPAITDTEATGSFNVQKEGLPTPNNNSISKGDVALFMLKESLENKYVHARVGISN